MWCATRNNLESPHFIIMTKQQEPLNKADWALLYSIVCMELKRNPKDKPTDDLLNKIRDNHILAN